MDAFDLIVGIVGLWAVVPAIIGFINCRLPSVKLRELYHTLDETESLLVSCAEDGSITDGGEFRLQLLRFRTQADDARRQVMCARTYLEDLKNFFFGLTSLINRIADGVKELGANISTTSTRYHKERLRKTEAERDRSDAMRVRTIIENSGSFITPSREVAVPASDIASASNFLDALHLSPALSIDPSVLTPRPSPHIESQDQSTYVSAQSIHAVGVSSVLDHSIQNVNANVDASVVQFSRRTRSSPARRSSASSSATNTRALRSKIPSPSSRQFTKARFLRRQSSGHPPPISTQTHVEIIWVSAESSAFTTYCLHDSEVDGWEDVHDPL